MTETPIWGHNDLAFVQPTVRSNLTVVFVYDLNFLLISLTNHSW
jgi:hypothetical protein